MLEATQDDSQLKKQLIASLIPSLASPLSSDHVEIKGAGMNTVCSFDAKTIS